MEAIHILTVVYSLNHLLLTDVRRQGELYDKAIHIGVLIETVHMLQEFLFGGIVLQMDEGALEPTCFTCQHFVFYIGERATVMTHQNSCQMGTLCPVGRHAFHLGLYLSLNGGCRSLSVYYLHSFLDLMWI